MENLERVMPRFTEKVVVKLSASALTSHRYTLNHKGAMLGWEMSPDQLGEYRPALNGILKNLYFVGHWTQPGGGITPVIVSAMQVARKITGQHPEATNAFNVNPWLKSANIRGVFSEL
jgi:prolycopene isomerase